MKIASLSLILALATLPASSTRAEVTQAQAQKLFNTELSSAELDKISQESEHEGVPKQVIAEAKLMWGLQHHDDAYLAKSLPELEAAAKGFRKEDSIATGTPEEFLGLINYIKALQAMTKGDEKSFKEYIAEAFWLSPDQGQLFAQTIKKHRLQQKMDLVTIDMKVSLSNSKGDATSLSDQLGKNKAILLDFWASWCGPCIALMPGLNKKAEYLEKFGVTLCSMNTESDVPLAEKVRVEKDMKLPWLVEPAEKPFSDKLEINTIPRFVLLSPEGKVLFNGHPQDDGLWAALKKVNPAIEEQKEEPPTNQ